MIVVGLKEGWGGLGLGMTWEFAEVARGVM